MSDTLDMHSATTTRDAISADTETSISQEIHASATLVDKTMSIIRNRIAVMSLAPGARLPSIRRLATTMSVSKSTIVEAYDRLVAEGVIQAKRGAGFYVADKKQPVFASTDFTPRKSRAINPYWVIRQSLETNSATLRPGCGWLPDDWLPDEAIRRALRAIARNPDANLSRYGEPLGFLPLRQHLSHRLHEQGVSTAPSQILLCDSGTAALDLIARYFIRPQDTVLIDDPCYFNFRGLLLAQQANLIGVPYTPQGPDLDAFSRLCEQHQPKLYISNAGLHNPTGAMMSPATAHRLLKLAEKHNVILVEDNIFADFHENPPPLLAELDGLERVIHIGSFSKSLSAATRVGYITARSDWLEHLTDLKLATNFASNALSAQIIHQVLIDGTYRRHIETIRSRLAQSHALVRRRLEAIGMKLWCEPSGGLFVWAQLPDNLPHGVNADIIARRALNENVVLAPGNVFSQSQSCGQYFRFNVAQSAHPQIYQLLQKIMWQPLSAADTDHGLSG